MDNEPEKEDVIDIDILDPVGDNSVIVLKDASEDRENDTPGTGLSVSNTEITGTGTLISKIFDLFAQMRGDHWKLEDKEIKSLNNTCPKILPAMIVKHSGLITCILSIINMVIKRLKKERDTQPDTTVETSIEEEPEKQGLTGGRSD